MFDIMQHFLRQGAAFKTSDMHERKINSERFTEIWVGEMEDELCIIHEQRERWKESDGLESKLDSVKNERSSEAQRVADLGWPEWKRKNERMGSPPRVLGH